MRSPRTRGIKVFLRRCLSSDTGTALGGRRARGRAHQLAVETVDALSSPVHGYLAGAQDVGAQRLHRVQPFDLHQASQQVRDAVPRRAHPLEELEAFAHSADLVPLQPEALGQVPPGLDHGGLAAVGGAQHAARLLQAVEGKLRGAQAWCWKMEVLNLTLFVSERRKQMTWEGRIFFFIGGRVGCVFLSGLTLCYIASSGVQIQNLSPPTLQHLC